MPSLRAQFGLGGGVGAAVHARHTFALDDPTSHVGSHYRVVPAGLHVLAPHLAPTSAAGADLVVFLVLGQMARRNSTTTPTVWLAWLGH